MRRLSGRSDEDLIEEIEDRGYEIKEQESSGSGCLVIGVPVLIVAMIFLTTYVHKTLYMALNYQWTIYVAAVAGLVLVVATRGKASFANFLLYLSNAALLTRLYIFIMEEVEGKKYGAAFWNEATAMTLMVYAVAFVFYIFITTLFITKFILGCIEGFMGTEDNSKDLSL